MEINFARRESIEALRQERERRSAAQLCAALMVFIGCLRTALLAWQPFGYDYPAHEEVNARERLLIEKELVHLEEQSRSTEKTLSELDELLHLGFPVSATLSALASLVSEQMALTNLVISSDTIVLAGAANQPLEVPRLVQSLETLFPGSCISLEGNATIGDAPHLEDFEAQVEGWNGASENCPTKGGTHGR